MSDQTALQRITERVFRNGDPDEMETPRPLLSLEEFFEGNDVAGCIGCNLPGHPGPGDMYAIFKAIAARPDVADVRVQITYFDDPDWPFSDTVYVTTSASAEEVATWFETDMAPDETFEGFSTNYTFEPYVVKKGYRAIGCWWD